MKKNHGKTKFQVRKMYVLGAVLLALLCTLILRRLKDRKICLDVKRLDGRTVLITGGNSGVGKVVAVALAKRGARVVITSPDERAGEEAVQQIRKESLNLDVHFMKLNMANLQSIRDFCQTFCRAEKRLHILINNAGVPAVLDWTEDGFSMCFGFNHLGPFLLTNLLLSLLKSSAPSRVVTITSDIYKYQKLDFQDLNYNLVPLFTYCRSKLANLYFTQELARQTQGTGVTAYAVHPGYVAGDWTAQFSLLFQIVTYVFVSMFFISCEAGAQTVIYCAISDEVLQHNGGYFTDCRPSRLCSYAEDAGIAKKLWEASEGMVGLTSFRRQPAES
ncbi:retinol dehydrogenase 12 isoform X2 [Microcaecilia unicolor]|uniref:Retinol dehydrogenase 12-like isoform X2 n=1 Tax=Microcaecilia unicolor TaxID=1415580 RepID=A0A6P7Z766_9AMPH|nr:retinol dehydrogenase 12-like isoform X2 [Microcaecilia unicolor]